MPKQRLDFKTFILLLLSSCFVIELSVKVLACVETKAGPFLILHYDLSAVLGDLFWVGGGVYSINFSNIFKTMFDFQGQRIEKRWAKEAEVRIQCQTCSETRSLASERQKMDTVRDRRRRVERDGEQEFEKLSKTKRGKRERRRDEQEAALCLDWGGTGTQLRTNGIIVIQPALEQSQLCDAQLEALGEMKRRGVWRSTKSPCCLEHGRKGGGG